MNCDSSSETTNSTKTRRKLWGEVLSRVSGLSALCLLKIALSTPPLTASCATTDEEMSDTYGDGEEKRR